MNSTSKVQQPEALRSLEAAAESGSRKPGSQGLTATPKTEPVRAKPEEEEKTDTAVIVKRMGLNRIFSSDLRVYLDSGEVVGISYINQPDGKFYPIDQINPEEQYLKEFKWNPALRPKTWQELLEPRKVPVLVEEKEEQGRRRNKE